jgi:hypothetical protein
MRVNMDSVEKRGPLTVDIGAWFLGFMVLPVAIYLGAYLSYFIGGHSLAQFIYLQLQMISYHSHLIAQHAYSSPWWSWPLMLRPVWFYSGSVTGAPMVIYAMGNPLLWWTFLPCITWVCYRFLCRRQLGDGLILLGFVGNWLPWMLMRRVTCMVLLSFIWVT